jgi:2-oxoacid dehydrogenases acyltransferase (catalytic domain)
MLLAMTRFTHQAKLSSWRRLALSTWGEPSDPQIFGWIDVDASALLAHIADLRRRSGQRVTVTHCVGKAIALAFAETPAANAVTTWRGVSQRDSVDVFFSVATDGGKGLSGAKICGADELAVETIAERLGERVSTIRTEADTALQKSQHLLARLPRPLLGPSMRLSSVVSHDLGLDLSRFGIPHDPFGTVVVTNVGSLGVEQGFGPLVPTGRCGALITVGAIRDKVIAVDGEPAVRPVLTLGATFDHRLVDGYQLGRISRALRRLLEQPQALSEPIVAGGRSCQRSANDERGRQFHERRGGEEPGSARVPPSGARGDRGGVARRRA